MDTNYVINLLSIGEYKDGLIIKAGKRRFLKLTP
jgi:hypothetical protein